MNNAMITTDSTDKLIVELLTYISTLAAEAMKVHGRFTIGLSGGSLIDMLAKGLHHKEISEKIDWSGWQVFLVDERWVPLTSDESNYYTAKKQFLDHVNIPKDQIYAYDTTLEPMDAAKAYTKTLSRVFMTKADQWPKFDLILLGLGEDGHIASLFPNHPLLKERSLWVSSLLDAPKLPPKRMTLTLPLINNAYNIAFVVAGSEKSTILSLVFKHQTSQADLPAQLVNPSEGDLRWFIDSTANTKIRIPIIGTSI